MALGLFHQSADRTHRSLSFIEVPGRGRGPKKTALDLRGAFLLFLVVTSLLFFLNRVSQGSGPWLWGWLLLGLACFGLLVFVELRSPSPLVDLHLFKEKLFATSLGTALLAFWMAAAHAFVVPFFCRMC